MDSFEQIMKRLQENHVNKKDSTPNKKVLEIQFEELMEIERKKRPISDERYNSLCDRFSIELGYDFSYKKITPETKMYRDARMRADFVKKEVEIEKIEPHALQRLFFTAFSPLALDTMIKHKVRPASCAIYSTLTLNCIISSGLAYMSKYDLIEKLNLSHANAPLYFNELLYAGLIVDRSNHRGSRKETTRFYLPHTHQHIQAYFQEEKHDHSGGDWILITPEVVEILASEKGLTGTHWYVYAFLSMNTYRANGVTMRALPKQQVAAELNLDISRRTIYRVFDKLQELGLISEEKHKKDVYFLPQILRKYMELAVKNGDN